MPITIAKWYLDCIDPEGEAFIGYAAQVGWAGLSLRYSGILTYRASEGVDTKMTLRRYEEPRTEDDALRWRSVPLGVDGSWEPVEAPVQAQLFTGDEGEVDWSCMQPSARARVQFGDGAPIHGWGYAERLTMTIPPWRLSIDELFWGRFVADGVSIVWIEWRGALPLRRVYVDGDLCRDAVISSDAVTIGSLDLELSFTDSVVLREGPLVSTVFTGIPVLRDRLPRRMLDTHETKWRSRAVLERGGRPASSGWAIHEVVRWG